LSEAAPFHADSRSVLFRKSWPMAAYHWGKNIARVLPGVLPVGVHHFYAEGRRTKAAAVPAAPGALVILHFECLGLQSWRRKFSQRAQQTLDSLVHCPLPYYRQSVAAARSGFLDTTPFYAWRTATGHVQTLRRPVSMLHSVPFNAKWLPSDGTPPESK
jgi:hypothetical protein